jgi:hypothetical protein
MEKRREKRLKKRVLVKFGESVLERIGFTSNLSKSGLYINSTQIYPSGRKIQILLSDGNYNFSLKGEVKWSIKYPSHFHSYIPSGMGIIIKEAPGDYYDFVGRT